MVLNLIQTLIKEGFLIDSSLKDFLLKIPEDCLDTFKEILFSLNPPQLISRTFFQENSEKFSTLFTNKIINFPDSEKKRNLEALKELFLSSFIKKEVSPSLKTPKKKEKSVKEKTNSPRNKLTILSAPCIDNEKEIEVADFVAYFRDRLKYLKTILENNTELENLTTINKISSQRQNISIIGMIYSINHTKNKNILLEIEDLTGRISVLIHQSKEELFNKTKYLVLDEVIAVRGSGNSEIIFANDVFFPEVIKQKKSFIAEEEIALFTGDLHVGSNNFLEENFTKFVKWINGEIGSEKQREFAKSVKYLFILGDLISGIGVYPGQEENLVIKDIKNQFIKFIELISDVRKDVDIIIIPGNHDPVRIAEPQPQFEGDYSKKLYLMENVYVLPNPSVVNIGISPETQGVNILLYHGYSFDYYHLNIDYLRLNRANERPEFIHRLLLQKRHLAPSHSSTLYIPNEKDNHLIRIIPDIFATGHLHTSSVANINNILCISASCWESRTDFQEKVGHMPDPCKVPAVNLKTGKVKILDFS
ncbi:hypothetical protein CO154_00920 [Candidatus Pacearchaeota archaeon CG_4_9_14_3_um_filter_31_7]|nr:MAG: hypothetical protein AUJ10_02600 [Candidatus Pacearchaeota archaeon CG1_02_31_27]PIN92461.1 MAG: hypothetical protein COU55_01505 [Candidatus Pacearchaeota archaeon CG10_big_fil_rev_8_21_14_0_10_31_59]PIZ81046.1 MAG: hypothetical protein COX99_01205 [Candidatus Pacearchaeota archaeon CG_4_10_14_0_2_um_filter_31_10]PJA70813.1 MAG: hypothetical protein CO154_00920 [Candidatus Pacearchaeota archaeon CG_4_9_14_3_um_filter_31_7]